ncbi:septation ring formation regulator EzrA [Enterococcus sp. CWB-B31]|uniref:septation ring formation regulator EzrA n=1 Tax=Enterococcus sp. CWB-B31 TaxID=2885159 RepID=UPI001E5B1F0A|nr:septation ring formation regulator EzrA [Enterococcus sp. CWB-B31]MCB5954677.1 septation ring formation regulator EzrA [Enterococcus sp. CWB-B31]
MKNNLIIIVVLVIIIVAAIIYLVGHFMRRKNQAKLKALESRKEDLFDLPVIEEVDEIKKMHMVGQSQNTFREWNQRWADISTRSFAELESQIFEVEELNDSFRYMKAKRAVAEAEKTMDEMESEVEEIRRGLGELRDSEERNSLEVQKALDIYEEISTLLQEEKEGFGSAYSELQKQVKNIEIEFTQFVTLNTSGDPVEAREVLESAERHTYELDDVMKRIPPLHDELNRTFPDQIKEIEEGYKRLTDDHFVFPEQNFEEELKRVKKRVKNSTVDLEKAEVAAVEVANRDTEAAIDALYEVMEKEINAKKYVVNNQKTIGDYIAHVLRNNRQLMIELDHTSQSYTLNHNELGRSRGFQSEIEELIRRYEDYEPKMAEHTVPYSEVQVFFKDCYRVLADIENQQMEIDMSLKDLRKGEKEAQKKVDQFEFRLRNLKRFVEKKRLPGLPTDYLEFFFVATDRIEELSKALNRIRINIDEINKLADLCNEDLEMLDKKTNDLVNSAALTEQMMQYANRYRHTNEAVNEAMERTLDLFSKDYRYQDALDIIGTALERVEPGAFRRIEDIYFKNLDAV